MDKWKKKCVALFILFFQIGFICNYNIILENKFTFLPQLALVFF